MSLMKDHLGCGAALSKQYSLSSPLKHSPSISPSAERVILTDAAPPFYSICLIAYPKHGCYPLFLAIEVPEPVKRLLYPVQTGVFDQDSLENR